MKPRSTDSPSPRTRFRSLPKANSSSTRSVKFSSRRAKAGRIACFSRLLRTKFECSMYEAPAKIWSDKNHNLAQRFGQMGILP